MHLQFDLPFRKLILLKLSVGLCAAFILFAKHPKAPI